MLPDNGPILADGEIAGHTTSAAYGYSVGCAMPASRSRLPWNE
jgi:hypothetical protein